MNKTVKNILIVLGVLFIIGAILNVVDSEPKFSDTARDNTFRNSFIVGCEQEAGKFSTLDCTCAYDALLKLYPDFATNTKRMNKILSTGYSQQEVKAVSYCY